VRVLATIKKSPLASEFGKECKDLQIWVEEILDSTNKHVVSLPVSFSFLMADEAMSDSVWNGSELRG